MVVRDAPGRLNAAILVFTQSRAEVFCSYSSSHEMTCDKVGKLAASQSYGLSNSAVLSFLIIMFRILTEVGHSTANS